MSAIQPYLDKARDTWTGLTERERLLMMLLAAVLLVFGLYVLVSGQLQKSETWRTGTQERRDAISLLINNRATYADAVATQRELNAKMSGNAVSIPSFVEARCRQLNITRPTNFRDSRAPVANNAAITALTTEVVFPEMTLAQLSDFSNAVYESGELLYIQRIDIKQRRGQTDGFEVSMQLTTYQLNDGE